MSRLLTFVACLLLPVVSLAMEPLSRVDMASSNVSIGAPLQGLLDDYVNLLSEQNSLTSYGNDGAFHSWSPHRDTLSHACRLRSSTCSSVLQAQFDVLANE